MGIDPNAPDFWLVLQPLEDPDQVPAVKRLAQALKACKRRYKLRCIDYAEVWPALPAAGAGAGGDGTAAGGLLATPGPGRATSEACASGGEGRPCRGRRN